MNLFIGVIEKTVGRVVESLKREKVWDSLYYQMGLGLRCRQAKVMADDSKALKKGAYCLLQRRSCGRVLTLGHKGQH